MNSYKITNYILVALSFFPIFVFKSGFSNFETLSSLFIFFLILYLINYVLFSRTKKEINFNNKFLIFYFSIIIACGIDNNLVLWNNVIFPFFHYSLPKELLLFNFLKNPYLQGFILLLLLSIFIYLIINKYGLNLLKIFTVFLAVIFVYNLFDNTRSYKALPSFDNSQISQSNGEQKKLVIILDEMSGINSLESSGPGGKEFVEQTIIFLKEYNFLAFSNASTISSNSASSLSAMLNYKETSEFEDQLIRRSKNYYAVFDLILNQAFDKFNNISVFQNFNINYCNHTSVIKCDQYNPFKEKNFINGYKNTILTKYISLWQIHSGSVISKIFWRSFRQLRLTDSALPPEGEKASIENLFKKIHKDIESNKFDLIFAHTLVPHTPYGFDSKCDYNGDLMNLNDYWTEEQKIRQHNIERICMLKYLKIFFENLKNDGLFEKLDIIIQSDHGSRINTADNSQLSSFFAVKNKNLNFKIDNSKKTIQKLFGEFF